MSPARPTIVPKQDEQEQPWQWSEARWRGIVERVRAGRALRPDAWPDGARCAVAISFDSDHETGELREGGESIGRLSQGQYGSRAGLGVSLTGIQSYATAKAAQLGLVRQLAHELGPHGITVNAVAPGFLRTSPDYERQWQSYGPEGQKAMIERVAMRRLGEPQDIAHAVMFLASSYASWITGQVLPVTGSPIS